MAKKDLDPPIRKIRSDQTLQEGKVVEEVDKVPEDKTSFKKAFKAKLSTSNKMLTDMSAASDGRPWMKNPQTEQKTFEEVRYADRKEEQVV